MISIRAIIYIIIILLLFRYRIKQNKINSIKLMSREPHKKLLTVGSVKIEPNHIDTPVKLGNYVFKVKSVEIDIIYKTNSTILSPALHYKDNTLNIKVYIEYKGNIKIITLNGNLNNVKNLYTSNLKIDDFSTQQQHIFFTLSIKQINIQHQTRWHGLILILNKLVETNNKYIPLYKNVSVRPMKTNLLNPLTDILYDNNHHTNKTPYKNNVDNYGVISKKIKDNVQRTDDIIRQKIRKDNLRIMKEYC